MAKISINLKWNLDGGELSPGKYSNKHQIEFNDKIVINGDPSQIDLPNKSLSGLNRSKKLLGHLNEISVVDFDHSDVVRHPLVSKIVKAYSDQNKD